MMLLQAEHALRERVTAVRNLLTPQGTGARSMFDADVISLAHGDGVRRPHADTIAAAASALLNSRRYSFDDYHFLQDFPPLAEAVVDEFRSLGIGAASAETTYVDAGSSRIICTYFATCTRPGDVFLIAPGFYHGVVEWCARFGIDLQVVRSGDHEVKLRPAAIRAWIAGAPADVVARLRGVIMFNPGFMGAVYTRAELEQVGALVEDLDLVAICDMVFAGTEFCGGKAASLASVDGLEDRVLTVRSASKTFNLANLRSGWACGSQQTIAAMRAYRTSTMGNVPFLLQSMTAAALRAPASYLRNSAAECQARAELVGAFVGAIDESLAHRAGRGDVPFLTVPSRPCAGHSILLDAPGLRGRRTPKGDRIENSLDLARFLLHEHGVAISPGYSLGFDAMQFRIGFGSVGLKETYEEPSAAEYAALRGERTLDDVVPARGFDKGRWILREALLERVLPACNELVAG